MIRNLKKALISVFILAVLSGMGAFAAFADAGSCAVSIPVTVKVTASKTVPETTYKVTLTAVTPGAPMPQSDTVTETAASGEKEVTLTFDPITYTVPNDYVYTVKQTSDAKTNFTMDTATEYRLTVRVTNGADGLEAVWWVGTAADAGSKPGSISFTNSYASSSSGGGGSHGGGGGGSTRTTGDGLTTTTGPGVTQDPGGELTPVIEEIVPSGLLPKTGDSTMLALWATLAAVSGGMTAILLTAGKRFF